MRALIELLVLLGNRVLVSSYTHSAIDNILVGLVGKVKMMRFAPTHRVHPKLKDFTERALVAKLGDSPTHELLEKMYSSQACCKLKLATNESVCTDLHRPVRTACGIRLTSYMAFSVELNSIANFSFFERFSREFGLDVSLFQRLDRPAVTTRLTRQYRMNRPINDLANRVSYDGLLECGSDAIATATLNYAGETTRSEDWIVRPLSKHIDDSIIIVNMKGQKESSKTAENRLEAEVVLQVAQEMVKVRMHCQSVPNFVIFEKMLVNLSSEMMPKNICIILARCTIGQHRRDEHVQGAGRLFEKILQRDRRRSQHCRFVPRARQGSHYLRCVVRLFAKI
ncbi:unnamed protein product [Nesidiocoris tenuis]|uniref:DNA2/NAM7 helicase-like C-terminal domain-containing protein n=1 Tax=Nesidiocoris tenuis TaxID=355587 RepID=A0A6H5HAA9_9HEMI|nr:unnamed protein product [Nesidiocoris tenuis]